MFRHSFALFTARRYSQPGLNRGLAGFLSVVSLSGLGLAVFLLIVVMSVMNGFEKELQTRMLALIPHVQLPLSSKASTQEDALEGLIQALRKDDSVRGVVPYLEGQVILGRGERLFSALMLGIIPSREGEVSALESHIQAGSVDLLSDQRYGMIIGSGLANQLNLFIGDKIAVTLPRVLMTPFGPVTRQKPFTVMGIFEVGSEVDVNLVMVNLDDARRLLGRAESLDGLRLALTNPWRSRETVSAVINALGPEQRALLSSDWMDWRDKNRALYSAVVMEKLVIFVLLLAVVAVATFNVVSIILMTATDKRGDIAILKTMGATTQQIRQLFILQGSLVGFAGTLCGAIAGVLVAPQVGTIVSKIEALSGWTLFDPAVYYIPYLPSVLRWQDVAVVCGLALILSVAVTVVPAVRASKISPVIALKESL